MILSMPDHTARLICDRCGYEAPVVFESAREAKQVAGQARWYRDKRADEDLCPRCKEKRKGGAL